MKKMTEKEKKAELFGKQSLLPTPKQWAELHQMYVATDKTGDVWMYATKPRKLSVSWVNDILGGFNITSLVKPQTGENWEDSLYIPTSLRTKYKAYTEPKIEWLKMYVKNKRTYKDCKIVGFSLACSDDIYIMIEKGDDNVIPYTLDEMFNDFTWLDGTPFGEEV